MLVAARKTLTRQQETKSTTPAIGSNGYNILLWGWLEATGRMDISEEHRPERMPLTQAAALRNQVEVGMAFPGVLQGNLVDGNPGEAHRAYRAVRRASEVLQSLQDHLFLVRFYSCVDCYRDTHQAASCPSHGPPAPLFQDRTASTIARSEFLFFLLQRT